MRHVGEVSVIGEEIVSPLEDREIRKPAARGDSSSEVGKPTLHMQALPKSSNTTTLQGSEQTCTKAVSPDAQAPLTAHPTGVHIHGPDPPPTQPFQVGKSNAMTPSHPIVGGV